MNQELPLVVSLADIKDSEMCEDIQKVMSCFKTEYDISPMKVIKVPGRVNLIGEHIDYCGFPVCPMALNKAIYIAVASTEGPSSCFVKASNFDGKKYPPSIIQNYQEKLDISLENYGWISYIACGIQGVIDLNMTLNKISKPKNMLMTVYGTVPPAGGLSSSSALVCAAFLATCAINNIVLSRTEMATICAEAEKYIGTCGGGMDQAIAFNGRKGYLKMVMFNPLRMKDVKFPDNAIVMIAHTLVEKNKAESNEYNLRVVECRIASYILAKLTHLSNWRELSKLAVVKNALDSSSFHEIMILVNNKFHDEPYTVEEICTLLEIDFEELKEIALTKDTVNVNTFKLKQRAKHVFEEADRVYRWKNRCASDVKSLNELGILMNKSHTSLQYLYECSHPNLDKLCSIFMMSGAYGAKLTGAGWGGFVVALMASGSVQEVTEHMFELFYKHYFDSIDKMKENAVFIVYPDNGAQVINV